MIDAERTETAYLKGLRDHFTAMAVNIVEKPGAPDQLVKHTRQLAARADYDEVWCMTDVDHYEREGGKVTAALAVAKKSGINVAVSDPCFELWLLLHHEECTAHCADCGAVERKLRKRLSAYDKARLSFRDFAGGLDRAIERARKLEPGRNPSTGVWRLVNAVLERE
ncbi:RloB family protein [Paractinoplanes durhamensis]|uniref:RloB-like protein n=1 Tax=Paractinoplanes durhamensis TaxID=113563 RepID=A0ABQ3YR34_9ACTN|nr:hypothetical protein Adu01nite_13300 [Actinoplanes durhamensis]